MNAKCLHICCFNFPNHTKGIQFLSVYIVHAMHVVFAHWSGARKHFISRCDKEPLMLTVR